MEVVRIPLAETRRYGGREVDAATVAMLKESMAAVGLLSPITATRGQRRDGPSEITTYQIVAGRHRVQAARELGWADIDAFVVELDAPHAELCEIDENLIRAELTDAQRAKAHARRAELMEGMGLVSRHGGARKQNDKLSSCSYAEATADALGVDKRTVQRDLRRGREIEPDVLADVAGTSLDKGIVLDQLAATPKPEQRAKLAEITLQRTEAERARKETEGALRHTDRVIALTEAQQFAEWLLARSDLAELKSIISWLEVAKPKDVIAALRREAA